MVSQRKWCKRVGVQNFVSGHYFPNHRFPFEMATLHAIVKLLLFSLFRRKSPTEFPCQRGELPYKHAFCPESPVFNQLIPAQLSLRSMIKDTP